MKELFKMLLNGGKIVSSNELSVLEIAEAKADRRMWVCDKGYGFVYIPSLDNPKLCMITN